MPGVTHVLAHFRAHLARAGLNVRESATRAARRVPHAGDKGSGLR